MEPEKKAGCTHSTVPFGPRIQLGHLRFSDPEKFMPQNMCKAAELQLLWEWTQTLNFTETDKLRKKIVQFLI